LSLKSHHSHSVVSSGNINHTDAISHGIGIIYHHDSSHSSHNIHSILLSGVCNQVIVIQYFCKYIESVGAIGGSGLSLSFLR
jgi:hypothetical protein